jgi:hypothetical protein
VLEKLPNWPKALKPRLLNVEDWTNSESAIAEIRACGALLEAGYPVQLGKKNLAGAKAEFHVEMNGVETIVEVWTRNLDKNEAARVAADLSETSPNRTRRSVRGGTISVAVTTVAPFGSPDPEKEGDSFLTNVISRIARIKEREHQAQDTNPFILWIDLQNRNALGGFDNSHDLVPIKSGAGGYLSSGGYWHALYGRKGDTLVEPNGPPFRKNTMLHDGRFYQNMKHGGQTWISGVIFSAPKSTVIMEHPCPRVPLQPSFRNGLLSLPHFDISLSLANWSEGLVERTVHVQRQMIAAVIASLEGSALGE